MAGTAVTERRIWIVLLASREDDRRVCREGFERYHAAGGTEAEVLSGGERALERLRQMSSARTSAAPSMPPPPATIVCWNAAAGMPPKEIEVLVRGLAPGEWRAGSRNAALSEGRGLKRWARRRGRWTGFIRARLGLFSDPHPPCIALPASAVLSLAAQLSAAPDRDWIGVLLGCARRDRVRVVEAPVMWVQPGK